MKTRLVIDGNAVYEIDEECEACLCRESSHAETDKRIGKMEKRETEEAQSVRGSFAYLHCLTEAAASTVAAAAA